ncbi:MAG: hypothetical protein ACP5MH_10500 [Thermoproteus sp.]
MHRLFSTKSFVVSISRKKFRVFVRESAGLREIDPASLTEKEWAEIQDYVRGHEDLVELYPLLMAWKFGIRQGCAKKDSKCVLKYLQYIESLEKEDRPSGLSAWLPL